MKNLSPFFLIGIFCCLGCTRLLVQESSSLQLPPDPAAFLSDIWTKSGAVSDVSGFAELRIESNDNILNSRNVFFVKRPGSIRIETLGFLSRPALFFTADSQQMELYALETNSLFVGETSAQNFSRIIGMPLELTEVVQTFLGQPPLLDCTDRRVHAAVDKGQYVFRTVCGNFSEQIHIDPLAKRISRYSLFEKGVAVSDYRFSNFQNIDGIFFPLKIEIYNYTYNTAATMNLDSISFESIPGVRFIIARPADVEVHQFEDLSTFR